MDKALYGSRLRSNDGLEIAICKICRIEYASLQLLPSSDIKSQTIVEYVQQRCGPVSGASSVSERRRHIEIALSTSETAVKASLTPR